MRQRSTKERRTLRLEFIHKYRVEIAELIRLNHGKYVRDTPEIKIFVDNIMRKELEYSPRTFYFDIWMAVIKDGPRIIKL